MSKKVLKAFAKLNLSDKGECAIEILKEYIRALNYEWSEHMFDTGHARCAVENGLEDLIESDKHFKASLRGECLAEEYDEYSYEIFVGRRLEYEALTVEEIFEDF